MAKKTNQKSIEWVDVHDDALMVELGIHLPNVKPIDPAIFSKTDAEKELLAKYRKMFKGKMTGNNISNKNIPIYGKLIITIVPDKEFMMVNKNKETVCKTTWSYQCGQADIPRILSKFGPLVVKYSWLGKEYDRKKLPFWYGK